MSNSLPSLRRPLLTFIKVSYYEMASIILLSGIFWLCVLPVFTIGSGIISLFVIINNIYNGTAPSTELGRVKYFFRLVKKNIIRGIIPSLFVVFIVANTIWYFMIVLVSQSLYYIIGGIIGLYLCFLFLMFSLRVINIVENNEADWRSAILTAYSISSQQPSFTILQISIAGVGVIVSIIFPISLLFLLPGGLMMFELVFHKELTGNDPQKILDRYRVNE